MLLALEWTVWVKHTTCGIVVTVPWEGHVRELVKLGQASTGMTGSCWAVERPKVRVQRLVLGSLYPLSISNPLK